MPEYLPAAIAVYLVCVNLLAVALTVSDKRRSVRHKYRVPEKTLFLIALCGGSIGEYCAMRIIRHKTLHKRFMWGLPLIIVLQLALASYIFIKVLPPK